MVDNIIKPEHKDFLEKDAINFKGHNIDISRILFSEHLLSIDYNLIFNSNKLCLFNVIANNRLTQLIFD